MSGKRTVYVDEDGNKKVDIRLWDTKQFIAKVRNTHHTYLYFYAAVLDGMRYVLIEECRESTGKKIRGVAVPLYAPINEGAEIIKPFIGFVKAFQQTVVAHENVPLFDPETAEFMAYTVYTEKELREKKENRKTSKVTIINKLAKGNNENE